jgi:hypothetical protein
MVLKAQRKIDEAMKNYRIAVEINPNFSNAYYNMGRNYFIEK